MTSTGCFSASCRHGEARCYVPTCSHGMSTFRGFICSGLTLIFIAGVASVLKISNAEDKVNSVAPSPINTSKGCFSPSCRSGDSRCYVPSCAQGISILSDHKLTYLL
jgi:hypothetical protein